MSGIIVTIETWWFRKTTPPPRPSQKQAHPKISLPNHRLILPILSPPEYKPMHKLLGLATLSCL